MKNLIRKSVFIFALTGASLGIASDNETFIDNATNREYRILSATELNQLDIKDFCRGKMEGVILSIEGTTLSFNIELDSNIFQGEKHTPRKVRVLKPCFMKCEKGVHYFSSNYRTWKTFTEFFRNNLDVSVDIDEETYLVNINLHLDLHQKDD